VTEHPAVFDGLDDYVEVADHPDYAIATTGELTVVARIRPDSLEMPAQERTGYVHWLGKGVPGQDEWTSRMHQLGSREGRDNRISCYGFNLDARAGGTRFGIGSHFQDELTPGQWLLVAGAWDAIRVSIYRDGVLRDRDLLDQSATGGPTITPEHGDAPVRIGTRISTNGDAPDPTAPSVIGMVDDAALDDQVRGAAGTGGLDSRWTGR
jgi:hypothetical protein